MTPSPFGAAAWTARHYCALFVKVVVTGKGGLQSLEVEQMGPIWSVVCGRYTLIREALEPSIVGSIPRFTNARRFDFYDHDQTVSSRRHACTQAHPPVKSRPGIFDYNQLSGHGLSDRSKQRTHMPLKVVDASRKCLCPVARTAFAQVGSVRQEKAQGNASARQCQGKEKA